jgi:hypothetical protein
VVQQSLVASGQGAVEKLQEGLLGTQKNLEGMHRQLADIYGDVKRQKNHGRWFGV